MIFNLELVTGLAVVMDLDDKINRHHGGEGFKY
jgi:hypothetical protein